MNQDLLLYRLTFSNVENGRTHFMYVRSECDKVAAVEAYIRMVGSNKYHYCVIHYCKSVDKRVVPVRFVQKLWNKSCLPY